MFRCEMCQTVVPAGVRSTKVVLKTRNRTYPTRGSEARDRGRWQRRSLPRKQPEYDKGGVGTEIVKEVSACPKCAAAAQAEAKAQAEVQAQVEMQYQAAAAVMTPEEDSSEE